MQKRATITCRGQITLPREVRQMLGVRSGDKLLFESDGKGVRIRPIRSRSAFSKYRSIGNPEIPSGRKNIGKWCARNEGRMTTAVDSNVVIALRDKDASLSLAAQNALDAAFNRGILVAVAPVFAELIAAPGRNEKFVGCFFEETGIGVDWELSGQIWRLAGRAFLGRAAPEAAQ